MSFVDAHDFPVDLVLRVLGVPASTYYGWRARQAAPSRRQLDDAQLTRTRPRPSPCTGSMATVTRRRQQRRSRGCSTPPQPSTTSADSFTPGQGRLPVGPNLGTRLVADHSRLKRQSAGTAPGLPGPRQAADHPLPRHAGCPVGRATNAALTVPFPASGHPDVSCQLADASFDTTVCALSLCAIPRITRQDAGGHPPSQPGRPATRVTATRLRTCRHRSLRPIRRVRTAQRRS
jgi:hypothetical protein